MLSAAGFDVVRDLEADFSLVRVALVVGRVALITIVVRVRRLTIIFAFLEFATVPDRDLLEGSIRSRLCGGVFHQTDDRATGHHAPEYDVLVIEMRSGDSRNEELPETISALDC